MTRDRNGLRLLALFGFLLLLCPAAPAQSLHLPPHEKIVLKNGLTVLLLEKHGVPLINIFALVKTGAAADPAGQEGLASITAGLLRKGTKTRTAQQFAADFDYIGGSFGADAGADFTNISAEFLTKDLARGLELFSDAVLHPTFPQNETDKILAQSLDGVKSAKDDPQSVLGLYYEGYLYGMHPYGRPSDGDELSLKRIQRDAVVKFYEANYAPGNTILGVAGEFDSAEMRKKLEETLGAWPARPVANTSDLCHSACKRQEASPHRQTRCNTNLLRHRKCGHSGERPGSRRDSRGQHHFRRQIHVRAE